MIVPSLIIVASTVLGMTGTDVTVEKQNALKPWHQCTENAADELYRRNQVVLDLRLMQAMADIAVSQCHYPISDVRRVMDPSPEQIGSALQASKLEKNDIARERTRIRQLIESRWEADVVEGL